MLPPFFHSLIVYQMTPKKIQFRLIKDPVFLLDTILINNASEVDRNLYEIYGLPGDVGTPEDNYESIKDRLSELVEDESDDIRANQILVDVLSVPVIDAKLSTSALEAVYGLEMVKSNTTTSTYQHRSGDDDIFFSNDDLVDDFDDLYEESDDVEDVIVPENNGSGIHWGEIIEGAVGGVLGALFEDEGSNTAVSNNTGNNNSGGSETSIVNAKNILILLVLLLVAYYLYKKWA